MRDDRLARSSKFLLIYRLDICYFKWHYFKSEGRGPDLRKWRGPQVVALRLWFYLQDGGEKRLASTWNKVTSLSPNTVLGYTAFQITSEDWTVPEFILVTPSTSVTTAYGTVYYWSLTWKYQLLCRPTSRYYGHSSYYFAAAEARPWNSLPVQLLVNDGTGKKIEEGTSSTSSINSPLSLSITPSLFHSRLKTFLFCKSFPTVAYLFFFRTDSTDSPDCLPILLSISVFTLGPIVFLLCSLPVLHSCCSML